MAWHPGASCHIDAGGHRLEARRYGPPPEDAETILLLHEGLGCVALWRDFPERLAAATGRGVFAWSRAGYGGSAPCPLPRPLDYMRIEGAEILPEILDQIGLRKGTLLGHSDGATIAIEYLGAHADTRIDSAILIAPHLFPEDIGLAEIARAKTAFEQGDLRTKLAKYHAYPDCAFRGWNEAWLDPGFRNWDITDRLPHIRTPILALQGSADPYGTPAQINTILTQATASEVATCLMPGLGHAPHLEAPEQTLHQITSFLCRLQPH